LKFKPKDHYLDWSKKLYEITRKVTGKWNGKSEKSRKSRESPKSRKSPKSPKSPKSEYSTKDFCNEFECQKKTLTQCYRKAGFKLHPDRNIRDDEAEKQKKEARYKTIGEFYNKNKNDKNKDKVFNEDCNLDLK